MICKFIQQLRVEQLFCFHRYVHIYRYIQRLSDSVGLSTQCNIPRREILINVCGRCNSIYTHCRLSWCWPSRAKREGRGIDCAFHSYTRTHINQKASLYVQNNPTVHAIIHFALTHNPTWQFTSVMPFTPQPHERFSRQMQETDEAVSAICGDVRNKLIGCFCKHARRVFFLTQPKKMWHHGHTLPALLWSPFIISVCWPASCEICYPGYLNPLRVGSLYIVLTSPKLPCVIPRQTQAVISDSLIIERLKVSLFSFIAVDEN